MTTRIDIIREAIRAEGGNIPVKCGGDYYADGPNSGSANKYSKAHRVRNETIYKVDKHYDGLTDEARKRVVVALRAHPGVKDAYLSRPYTHNRSVVTQGHLKIVFDGTAYSN